MLLVEDKPCVMSLLRTLVHVRYFLRASILGYTVIESEFRPDQRGFMLGVKKGSVL